jgi:hypothetical protein
MIFQTCSSHGGCSCRRPGPREIPSRANGLLRATRPALAEVASLNIARSAGTVPLREPPASHSATTLSSIASIGRAPYRATNAFVRSRLWMLVDPFGLANSGSVVQRSQKAASVTGFARSSPRRARASSRARFASALVANVPDAPSTRETLTFRLRAES